MNCSLCKSTLKINNIDEKGRIYHICDTCGLIQLDKKMHILKNEEKQRYMLHDNSADNEGYLKYLHKIIKVSLKPFLEHGDYILDFGCGPEKTWSKILEGLGYHVSTFDPYFDNNIKWLKKIFNAITAIEVFEHLASPANELESLSSSIRRGGYLILRTMLHKENWEIFNKWWYKEDPTHISFYSKTTINYICKRWNFRLIQITDNCEIVLKKL
jgi:hypothetical protein